MALWYGSAALLVGGPGPGPGLRMDVAPVTDLIAVR
ncbi:Uncharacterised protein [Yersinia thracica]|uniref:Uncharacterized protein n=1 Tax=Yersinia thracica TaxID=2890319 RepID=A0A0T9PM23_9GAMM|nr:Uncharacterised protein [Yersinia thracica]